MRSLTGRRALIALLLLLDVACATPRSTAPEIPMNTEASAGVAHPGLARLLSDHWEWTMARWPEWATRLGDHRYDDRVADRSIAAADAELAQLERFLARAGALSVDELGPTDRVTHALFMDELQTGLGVARCRMERWSVGARDNPVVWMNEIAETQVVTTEPEAEQLLARYAALAIAVDQARDALLTGLDAGLVANAESLRRALTMLDAALAEPDQRWLVVTRAGEARAGWTAQATDRFERRAVAVVERSLRPAITRFRDALAGRVLPRARGEDRVGLWALPGGDACYAALTRRHTSLELSPEEVADFGRAELTRVHAEMRALGLRLFQTDDLPTIFTRLREDPDLYFRSAAEVEERANDALLAAKRALPRAFGRLPAADCEVRPIPEYEAPFSTIAYYMPAVPEEAPGYYYVNTYAPETRPRFEAAVLAYHESVPGHHLQIAFAQEQGALPAFRRHLGTTAFVEGWALYSERLADELGLYPTDLDRMGMLSFDSWRASRLVVDTGLHALRWTRAESEAFLRANTPLAYNNISNEVDRYISWPGQALAYKLGQREILRLRDESERALGPAFELAGFHEALLSGGAVTLPVLEQQIRRWREARAPMLAAGGGDRHPGR